MYLSTRRPKLLTHASCVPPPLSPARYLEDNPPGLLLPPAVAALPCLSESVNYGAADSFKQEMQTYK